MHNSPANIPILGPSGLCPAGAEEQSLGQRPRKTPLPSSQAESLRQGTLDFGATIPGSPQAFSLPIGGGMLPGAALRWYVRRQARWVTLVAGVRGSRCRGLRGPGGKWADPCVRAAEDESCWYQRTVRVRTPQDVYRVVECVAAVSAMSGPDGDRPQAKRSGPRREWTNYVSPPSNTFADCLHSCLQGFRVRQT